MEKIIVLGLLTIAVVTVILIFSDKLLFLV